MKKIVNAYHYYKTLLFMGRDVQNATECNHTSEIEAEI